MARHSTISLSSVLVALVAANIFAQTPSPGSWEQSFNHVVPSSWVYGDQHANYGGLNKDGEPPTPYAEPGDPPRFLAGHMALIPWGTQQGKVLVWNFMRPFSGAFDTALYFKQYWSILDPVNKTSYNNVLALLTKSEVAI